jgi:beta-galactosidase/beta-glucuronidase
MSLTPLHPRPQFMRGEWTDLCGAWSFAHDDEDCGLRERWYQQAQAFSRTIQVPFPPESRKSGIHETGFHPIVWYSRTFTLRDVPQRERLLLHFGAVDYQAMVWVNGQLVAQHEGGHTPFSADITHALDINRAEQVIVVRAADEPEDLTQPRGKQTWRHELNEIWYHRTTGIWQPVWLEPVAERYIQSVRLTPHADDSAVEVDISLNHAAPGARLAVRISFGDVLLADDEYTVSGTSLTRRIALPLERYGIQRHHIVWSPEHPHLIDVQFSLHAETGGGDVVRSYFGLRSVGTQGGRFFLNNHPYYLRMVLEQGYWPESLLAAPDENAIRVEVEWIKRLGFNAVRIHQKIEDPRFLYWCDRLGVIVWGEMANAYTFSAGAVTRLMREWLEAVARDYNHPCIVAWVPINESWGVPHLRRDPAQQAFVRAMTEVTRALDPTRLVIGNDGWEFVAGDVIGIHDYTQDGSRLTQRYGNAAALETSLYHDTPGHHVLIVDGLAVRGQPVMITEFGGIAFDKDTPGGWGYGRMQSPAGLLDKYAELVDALHASDVIAGFCYTQLTDTEQEVNGLLTAARAPKADPEAIAAVTQHKPRILPQANEEVIP